MKSFRIYHILFAIGVATAWLTAEELGLVHAWTGYVIAALVALRLLLGLARRRGFEFRRMIPRGGTAPAGQDGLRHPLIAHSLTLLLFACVVGTAGTGIAMDQGGTLVGKSIRAHDEEREGRGREHEEDEDEALTAPSSLFGLAPAVRADDDGGEDGDAEEGPLGEVHETLGNLLLPLALLHAAYLLLFRLDLAKFMLFLPRRRA